MWYSQSVSLEGESIGTSPYKHQSLPEFGIAILVTEKYCSQICLNIPRNILTMPSPTKKNMIWMIPIKYTFLYIPQQKLSCSLKRDHFKKDWKGKYIVSQTSFLRGDDVSIFVPKDPSNKKWKFPQILIQFIWSKGLEDMETLEMSRLLGWLSHRLPEGLGEGGNCERVFKREPYMECHREDSGSPHLWQPPFQNPHNYHKKKHAKIKAILITVSRSSSFK